MVLIKYLAIVLILLQVTFVLFVFCMAAKAKWSELKWWTKTLSFLPALVGLIFDASLNYFGSPLLLLSLPRLKEPLFTAHCERLMGDNSIQGARARMWCEQLDVFQIGGHCHKLLNK